MTTRKVVNRKSLNPHIFTYHWTSSFMEVASHLFMIVHADIDYDLIQQQELRSHQELVKL